MLIKWESRFTLNHKIIDKEHQQIVDSLNNLHQNVIEQNEPHLIYDEFNLLISKTKKNFETEEQLMREKGYKDIEEHSTRHAALIKQAQDLLEMTKKNETQIDIKITMFLKSWLTHHILISDKELVRWLASN